MTNNIKVAMAACIRPCNTQHAPSELLLLTLMTPGKMSDDVT